MLEELYVCREEKIYYVKVKLGVSCGGKEGPLNHVTKPGHHCKVNLIWTVNHEGPTMLIYIREYFDLCRKSYKKLLVLLHGRDQNG